MKQISLITILVALLLTTIPFTGSVVARGQSGSDARAIMKKASDLVDYKDIKMTIKLQTFSLNGGVREREIESSTVSESGVTKMSIKVLSPPDQKGIEMTIHDYDNKSDDMWIYLPSLRKTRRIASNEKSAQFFGSEFLNSDMSRPSLDDYSHKLLREESINGQNSWVIESTPLNDAIVKESGFYKKISYITKSDNLCRKIEYFDSRGGQMRVQEIKQFQKNGATNYIATEMEVLNLRNQRRSTIKISTPNLK